MILSWSNIVFSYRYFLSRTKIITFFGNANILAGHIFVQSPFSGVLSLSSSFSGPLSGGNSEAHRARHRVRSAFSDLWAVARSHTLFLHTARYFNTSCFPGKNVVYLREQRGGPRRSAPVCGRFRPISAKNEPIPPQNASNGNEKCTTCISKYITCIYKNLTYISKYTPPKSCRKLKTLKSAISAVLLLVFVFHVSLILFRPATDNCSMNEEDNEPMFGPCLEKQSIPNLLIQTIYLTLLPSQPAHADGRGQELTS